MKNQSGRHGGTFLQVTSQKQKLTRFFILGAAFIVVAVIVLITSLRGSAVVGKVVYRLPDEVPEFSFPEALDDNHDSRNLDELVVPYFDLIIEAGDHSIDVSLPIIKASYGSAFNTAVLERVENLVSNTLYHLENDICLYESLTYEAYLDQEILTVLLHTKYTDGQSRCQPWIFDLAKGGMLVNDTCELTERLMGMDYSSFLWITDRYIQNLFADTYFDDARSVPEEEMTSEQLEFLDLYRGIVREIPRDISNAFNRWIFPTDGKVFLVFQLPQITDDWHNGFRSETRVVEIDESMKYTDMVTPKEAVLEAVLNSTVHVMGATAQSHALLTRAVFYSSPEEFISAAACVPETDHEYMVESLVRYVDDSDCSKILEICWDLTGCENLTNSESNLITEIITKINETL